MQKMNTEFALKMLANGGNDTATGCLYMEVGLYKPWSMPVIIALKRRGYKVENLGQQTFLLYPKPSDKELGASEA